MIARLIASLILAQAPADAEPAKTAWRYVLPAPGDPGEHPPARALALSREKPEDVIEKASYRGRSRRYGQIRFGTASSVRVTVVLDKIAPGRADLYVDSDRNRRIEDRDRAEGADRAWRLPLDVAVVEGEVTTYLPRAATFRLGSTGLTLAYAASGYLEGEVRLGDKKHRARRADGDGNGLLADAQDRIWIDLDDDGRWDAATEQFLFAPILAVGDSRFAVRSDELGRRLALAPLEGTGTVTIAPARPQGVAGLAATLIGRDGSAVGLSSIGAEATVPVGEYRVGTLTIALDDPAGGARWNFVFAAEGARGEPSWHKVEKGGRVAIDPIGVLSLGVGPASGEPGEIRPGDDLAVRPSLFTGDGLLIVTCYRGAAAMPAGHNDSDAAIALVDASGTPVATARSGFA